MIKQTSRSMVNQTKYRKKQKVNTSTVVIHRIDRGRHQEKRGQRVSALTEGGACRPGAEVPRSEQLDALRRTLTLGLFYVYVLFSCLFSVPLPPLPKKSDVCATSEPLLNTITRAFDIYHCDLDVTMWRCRQSIRFIYTGVAIAFIDCRFVVTFQNISLPIEQHCCQLVYYIQWALFYLLMPNMIWNWSPEWHVTYLNCPSSWLHRRYLHF